MYSKDFDRSFCSESDILRGPVGSMDTDRAVLHEVWRPEGEYISPEFVGGEVQSKNERECRDKICLLLETVGGKKEKKEKRNLSKKTQTSQKQQHSSQALVSSIILLSRSLVSSGLFPRNERQPALSQGFRGCM